MFNPIHNSNCDGEFCRAENGEVRVWPVNVDRNAILCKDCFENERLWKIDCELTPPEEIPDWDSLKIYLIDPG